MHEIDVDLAPAGRDEAVGPALEIIVAVVLEAQADVAERRRLDQRRRRAEEIGSAARKFVRDCAHAGRVLDIREWAERRWRKDGPPKRKAMTDALHDEIRLGVAVVDIWRRFEIGGRIACELIGAKTYADLYRILRDKELAPGFQPREVVQWVADGKMDCDRVGEIFGIADGEVDAFLSAWLASEDTPKDDEEP